MTWLVVHLVAVAVLTGVGWVVQLLVYPAFTAVDPGGWTAFHAAHSRRIAATVALPWAAQGASTAALLVVAPGPGTAVLAVLALGTVVATVAVAVPAHGRLATAHDALAAALPVLLRANLVRTLAWTASTAVAAFLLLRTP